MPRPRPKLRLPKRLPGLEHALQLIAAVVAILQALRDFAAQVAQFGMRDPPLCAQTGNDQQQHDGLRTLAAAQHGRAIRGSEGIGRLRGRSTSAVAGLRLRLRQLGSGLLFVHGLDCNAANYAATQGAGGTRAASRRSSPDPVRTTCTKPCSRAVSAILW